MGTNTPTQKDVIIAKLCALRAGLSVIAIEQKKIDDRRHSMQPASFRTEIDHIQTELRQVDAELSKQNAIAASSRNPDPPRAGWANFFVPAIISFVVVFLIAELISLVVDEAYHFVLLAMIYILPIVVGVIFKKRANKRVAQKEQEEYLQSKATAMVAIQALEARKKELQKKEIESESRYHKKLLIYEKELNTIIIPQTAAHVKAMYQAMLRYQRDIGLTDERYWYHIDLLIYYFATIDGLTMNTALHMVANQTYDNLLRSRITRSIDPYIRSSTQNPYSDFSRLLDLYLAKLIQEITYHGNVPQKNIQSPQYLNSALIQYASCECKILMDLLTRNRPYWT